MRLDIPTLGILGFLIGIALSVGFTLLGLVLPQQRVLRLWAAGFWMATLGALFTGLRNQIDEGMSVVLGNLFIAISGSLMLAGVARHVERPLRRIWPLLFIVVFVAAQSFFEYVVPSLRVRLHLFSVQMVVWDVCTVWMLLRHGPGELRTSCRLAAAVFACDALFYAVRPFMPLAADAGEDAMRGGTPIVATYVIGVMLALGWFIAFMLLLSQRLAVDLGRLARIDGLTGLLNRGALIDEGRRALAHCRSRGRPFALLIFDLDYFKRVNDTFGHDGGDALLRQFSALIGAVRDPGTLLSRYGGEEFVLALPNVTLGEAAVMAEDMRQAVAATEVPFGNAQLSMTTSIGVAVADATQSFEELIARADEALYRAKAAGRNQVSAC
jgi:diguanylate cyclase (GGDEF)-like protein